MKDVRDWDESDLDLIVKADQKETTALDYKDSAALNFKDKTPRSDGKGTLGDSTAKTSYAMWRPWRMLKVGSSSTASPSARVGIPRT
jgi:hypothetical protein